LRATAQAKVGENQAVTVAGLTATQFDLTANPNPSQAAGENIAAGAISIPAIAPFVGVSGTDWHTNNAEARLRFIVLEVNGRTLFIYIEAPKNEFETFVADAEQVLKAVAFVK
jgi:hypothetical protein